MNRLQKTQVLVGQSQSNPLISFPIAPNSHTNKTHIVINQPHPETEGLPSIARNATEDQSKPPQSCVASLKFIGTPVQLKHLPMNYLHQNRNPSGQSQLAAP
jgi:hypothetical protein